MIGLKKLMLNVKVERRVVRFVNDRKNVMKRGNEVEKRRKERRREEGCFVLQS